MIKDIGARGEEKYLHATDKFVKVEIFSKFQPAKNLILYL